MTDELKKKIEYIQGLDSSLIARTSELGSKLGFDDSAKDAEGIISIFRKLDPQKIEELPNKHIKTISSQADTFISQVQGFQAYDPSAQNAVQIRDGLVRNFASFKKSVYDQLADPISFQHAMGANSDIRLEKEKKEIREKKEELNSALEHHRKVQEEFENLTATLRIQAAESGVTQEAIHFQTEADEHCKSASIWRGFLVFCACITIAYVFISMKYMHPPETAAAAINFVTNKLMIFGILVFLLSISAKNFMSHMHNKTINRHRRNALLTYNTLVGGAISDEAKDVILKTASSCIYSPQDTGYIRGNNSSTINSIIEMMPRTVLEGKI